MPNVVEQRVTQDELYIRASNGNEITLTKADILNLFNGKIGTPAQKKTAALTDLRNQIVSVLGSSEVNLAKMLLDFNEADGTPLRMDWGP